MRVFRGIAGLILAFWLGATTFGAWSLITIPNTFVAGTTIVAADMNANFSEISSKYNTLANSSTGHRHDGGSNDGARRVLATDLDSAGSKPGQVPIPSGAVTTWTAQENMLSGRLERQSATELRYNVFNGRYLEINGEVYTVDGTVAGGQVLTTDNLLTATGADAAAAMGASTTYYIYCSNASASPFPSDCRASATASTAYRGGQYLGATGNAANWRLVGMARTNSATNFVDTATQRFVRSYHNRGGIIALANAFTADRSTTSTTYVELDTEIRIEFLVWSNEVISVMGTGSMRWAASGGAGINASIGFDGATAEETAAQYVPPTSNIYVPFAVSITKSGLSQGYHFATLLGLSSSASFAATWRGSLTAGDRTALTGLIP